MLSKMVVDAYGRFLELALWLSLIVFVFGGWQAAPGELSPIVGAMFGFVGWVIFAVVFCGAFLVINDIRNVVRRIEEKK